MSSDSEYDENPSDQKSENGESEDNAEPTTSNGAANGNDSGKSVTWNDLVWRTVNEKCIVELKV